MLQAYRQLVTDLHLRHCGADRDRGAGPRHRYNNVTSNDALTGTADANATVTLSEGSTVLGSTTANGSGVWSFTPTGLAQGAQTITASETNAAGLTGSSSLTFTYDTTAPTVTAALAHAPAATTSRRTMH